MNGDGGVVIPHFPEDFLASIDFLLAVAAKHQITVVGGGVQTDGGLVTFSNLADARYTLPDVLRAFATAVEQKRDAGLVVDKQVPRVV